MIARGAFGQMHPPKTERGRRIGSTSVSAVLVFAGLLLTSCQASSPQTLVDTACQQAGTWLSDSLHGNFGQASSGQSALSGTLHQLDGEIQGSNFSASTRATLWDFEGMVQLNAPFGAPGDCDELRAEVLHDLA